MDFLHGMNYLVSKKIRNFIHFGREVAFSLRSYFDYELL